ncbi:MAG TPA: hypothetical protein VFD62_17490 [Pyrinomonadaceae bacterium]|nr:hypothetical protein [Pyrinomonadaceae bacterium]
MNTIRIATWFFLLSMGVIPATKAINFPVIVTVAPQLQSSEDQSDNAGEVLSDKNWQKHPKIVAIRRIVNSDIAGVRNGAFKTEHRICDKGWFSRLRIARDSKGVVRWYQNYGEGEDSSRDDNYYFDDAGRLRFVLMTTYAANGTREQHRAYFDESGLLIYHGRRLLKGPGYFGPQVDDLKKLVQMDPKKDFAESGQGCKEIKPSAKHHGGVRATGGLQ